MLMRLFFEQWWLLCGLLVVVELVCFAVWTRSRTRLAARVTWISLAAVVLLPLLSHLVVTRRERIERLCRDMAHMVDVGDMIALGAMLSGDFEVAGLDSEAFLERTAKALTRYRIDNPSLSGIRVTFPQSGQAVAVFNVVCAVRSAENYLDRLFSRWRLTLVEVESGWQVVTIEAVPSPLSPIRDIRDYLR